MKFMRFHLDTTIQSLIKISNERSNYLGINLFTGDPTTILKLFFFSTNNPLQFNQCKWQKLPSHLPNWVTKQDVSLNYMSELHLVQNTLA